MDTISLAKDTALKLLELDILERENKKERDEIAQQEEIKRGIEQQKKILKTTRDGIEARKRLDALGAFFQTDALKKQGKESLAVQAKSFRDQITVASQSSRQFFELNKALNLSTALIEAPKAILSAFKFGTEFGGLPLGVAFATAAAAATGALVGQIASAQFRGGRQTGGPVTSGGAFRVNETGGPELLSVGNRDFLLTGDQGGNITANKKMNNGSNVMMNVTIINNGEPAEATVEKQETSEGFDLVVMLDRIDESVANGIKNGDSRTNEAIQGTFALNRAAGSTL